MRNSIFTTIIFLFIFLSTNNAQNSFFSKSYLELNLYQLSVLNSGIDRGVSHDSPNLLRGLEYGYFFTERISGSIGYSNKDQIYINNIEPFTLLGQSIENSDEFYLGLEYFLPYKKIGLAIATDLFYRVGDEYHVSEYGFLPGKVETFSVFTGFGITPSLQFQYQVTSNFSIRIGTAVSFSRQNSVVTRLNYPGTLESLSEENVKEFFPLHNLSLRFRLASKK